MGQIRIIGGAWKRTPISVSDREGLRPTPDRVRETLFNWLGQNLQGWRCLDLFAGSGALGVEAGSRGAQEVVLVEPDPRAAHAISQLIEKLNAKDRLVLVTGKAQEYLSRAVDCRGPSGLAMTQPFDLVFLDPPFGKGLAEALMPQVLALLSPHGCIYLESDKPLEPGQAGVWGLEILRQDKAGAVHYHLLTRRQAAKGDANVTSSLSGDI
jgi:16S rRNA (guanine966-N2)-methyltransferase